MRILTDLDNSILSFAPHFENWAERAGHRIKRGMIDQTYDFADMFIDEMDYEAMLQPFFACDDTMGSFQALPNTVEPIQRLHAQGHEFVGITACSPRDGLAEVRHQNLKELFGFEFEEVFVTGYDVPKSEVLKKYEPTIWVEDHFANACDGAALGHKVFLIDHPYNQGDGPFTRVKDWLEIEEYVNGLR